MYNPETSNMLSKDSYWNPNNIIYGGNNSLVPNICAMQQSSNLYAYCMNNPVTCVDITGLYVAMYVGVHQVYPSASHHTQIIVVADRKSIHYIKLGSFNYPQPGVSPFAYKYFTIGAGGSKNMGFGGNLKAEYDRKPKDIDLKIKVQLIEVKRANGSQITDSDVTNLMATAERYMDYSNESIEYDIAPESKSNINKEIYNSNSFITGLLRASGLTAEKPKFKVPGWDKPVPEEYYMRTGCPVYAS